MRARVTRLGLLLGWSLLGAACAGTQDDELSEELEGSGNIDGGNADASTGDQPPDAARPLDASDPTPDDAGDAEQGDADVSQGDGDQGDGDQGDGDQGDGDQGDGDGLSDASAGDGDSQIDDASISADAGDASGPTTGFSVSVVDPDGPLEEISLFFHESDGGTREFSTNSNGIYVADHAPSAVTVVDDVSGNGIFIGLITYFRTEDQDALLVRLPRAERSPTPASSYLLDYPRPLPATTTQFETQWGEGCSQLLPLLPTGDAGVPLSSPEICQRATNAVLVGGFSANGLDGFAYAKGVGVPDAGQTEVVQLTGWSAPSSFALSATNFIEGTDRASAELYMVASGFPFLGSWNHIGFLPYGDTLNYQFSRAFADNLEVKASNMAQDGFRREIDLLLRTPNVATNSALQIDFGMPVIDRYTVTQLADRTEVAWAFVDDQRLTTADAQLSVFSFRQELGPDRFGTVQWLTVLPPDVSSFTFPQITLNMPIVPDPDGLVVITSLDASDVGSYAGFKRRMLDFTRGAGGHSISDLPVFFSASGDSGSVRATSVLPPDEF